MFDLAHDDSFELDLLRLDSSSSEPPSSSSEHHLDFVGSPSSSSVASSPGGGGGDGGSKVFGSFMVDRNSSTPYTDATQVK